jgi:hypothetical protein
MQQLHDLHAHPALRMLAMLYTLLSLPVLFAPPCQYPSTHCPSLRLCAASPYPASVTPAPAAPLRCASSAVPTRTHLAPGLLPSSCAPTGPSQAPPPPQQQAAPAAALGYMRLCSPPASLHLHLWKQLWQLLRLHCWVGTPPPALPPATATAAGRSHPPASTLHCPRPPGHRTLLKPASQLLQLPLLPHLC